MQELIDKLEQTATEVAFSGVISVFKEASVVFNEAFGYRDIKNKLPNTIDTLFGIASGTKLFTALGIGVLVDHGRLSLDTTVGEIDPEYTGFIDEHATIQHLLTHTSGIYDYYDEEIEHDYHFFVEIPWCDLETPTDYFTLFKGKAIKFRPGERYAYSNGGYVFMGMLIEKLTGTLYLECRWASVRLCRLLPGLGLEQGYDVLDLLNLVQFGLFFRREQAGFIQCQQAAQTLLRFFGGGIGSYFFRRGTGGQEINDLGNSLHGPGLEPGQA